MKRYRVELHDATDNRSIMYTSASSAEIALREATKAHTLTYGTPPVPTTYIRVAEVDGLSRLRKPAS